MKIDVCVCVYIYTSTSHILVSVSDCLNETGQYLQNLNFYMLLLLYNFISKFLIFTIRSEININVTSTITA